MTTTTRHSVVCRASNVSTTYQNVCGPPGMVLTASTCIGADITDHHPPGPCRSHSQNLYLPSLDLRLSSPGLHSAVSLSQVWNSVTEAIAEETV